MCLVCEDCFLRPCRRQVNEAGQGQRCCRERSPSCSVLGLSRALGQPAAAVRWWCGQPRDLHLLFGCPLCRLPVNFSLRNAVEEVVRGLRLSTYWFHLSCTAVGITFVLNPNTISSLYLFPQCFVFAECHLFDLHFPLKLHYHSSTQEKSHSSHLPFDVHSKC